MAEYMTVAEAARELGLTPRAVHKRIASGLMTAERYGPRVVLVPAAEVERLKGQGRFKPGPAPKRPRKEEPAGPASFDAPSDEEPPQR